MYQSYDCGDFEDGPDVVTFNSKMIPSQRRNRPAKSRKGPAYLLRLRLFAKQHPAFRLGVGEK